MVSTSVRKHIGLIVDSYDRSARRQSIVFATLPGERHELGLLMSAMICASHGCKVHYLGADLPPEEIARYAREVGAAIVAISVVLLDGAAALAAQLAAIRAVLGPGRAGLDRRAGRARPRRAALPASCLVIGDRAELEQRLDVLPR